MLLPLRLHRRTFSKVESRFTVLMCAVCQAARGHGSDPYPAITRAELRAGLGPAADLGAEAEGGRQSLGRRGHAPAPGRRGAGGSHVPAAGAGLAGGQAEVMEDLVTERQTATKRTR